VDCRNDHDSEPSHGPLPGIASDVVVVQIAGNMRALNHAFEGLTVDESANRSNSCSSDPTEQPLQLDPRMRWRSRARQGAGSFAPPWKPVLSRRSAGDPQPSAVPCTAWHPTLPFRLSRAWRQTRTVLPGELPLVSVGGRCSAI